MQTKLVLERIWHPLQLLLSNEIESTGLVHGMSFCQDSSRKKSPKRALIVDAAWDTIGVESGNESSVLYCSRLKWLEIRELKRSMKLVSPSPLPTVKSISYFPVTLPSVGRSRNIGSKVRKSGSNVSVKSKLQHPPRAYPGHLTSFPAREEGIWLT